MELSSCCKHRDRGDRRTIRRVRPQVEESLTRSWLRPRKPTIAVPVSLRDISGTGLFLCRRPAPRTGDCIPYRCTRKWAFELLIPSTAGAKPRNIQSSTRPAKGRSSPGTLPHHLLSRGIPRWPRKSSESRNRQKPKFVDPYGSCRAALSGPPLLKSICGEFANLKVSRGAVPVH